MSYRERERGGNDRDRNRPNDNRGNRREGGNGGRPDRAPLEWRTEQTFQCERIVLVLQRADLEEGGQRRSFRLGKESRDNPDKPFPFMDPRDAAQVRVVLAEMEGYLTDGNKSGLRD